MIQNRHARRLAKEGAASWSRENMVGASLSNHTCIRITFIISFALSSATRLSIRSIARAAVSLWNPSKMQTQV